MVCYPKRVFKNEDIDIAINVPEDEVNEFSLYILTDKEATVEVPLSAVTDGVVHFEPGDLDLLNDGIIRYELSYSVGDNDYAENANTNLILKTPSTYSAKTAEDWYNEGYEAGLNDCSGETPDCSAAYESGYTSGYTDGVSEQKAKLTGLTANTNMIYERTDGYDRVVVNVPTGYSQSDLDNAYDSGYTAGLNDCSGETPDCSEAYQSGYTEGFNDGQNSVDCSPYYNDGFVDGYASGQTDCPQCDCTDSWNSGYTSGYTDGLNDCTGYTQQDLDNAYNSGFSAGYIQGKKDCDDSDYLTFDVVSAGTLFFVIPNENTRDIEYRLNYSAWTTFESTGNTFWDRYAEIYLNVGDTIQFRGDNPTYSGANFRGTNNCVAGNCLSYSVRGNIMSLVDSQGFETLKTLVSASTFANMFMQNAMHIISVSGLTLPATSLTEGCYSHMFISNSFEKAPELPAAVVPANAYRSMFEGCSNLNYIKCLASDISGQDSTTYWVTSVQTNSGTFVKDANMNSWTTGIDGIPANWTVVDA